MYSEPQRKPALRLMMRSTPGVALGIDDCAAIQIVDGQYRIISSKKGRNAYKLYWKDGRYHQEKIPPSPRYAPLGTLLSKESVR